MKNIPADAVRHHRFPDALLDGQPLGREAFAALDLFGVRLTDAAPEEIADHIVRSALNGFSRTINFLNAHCVNVLRTDRTYAASLRGSDMVLPDGIGVELAARMAGLAKPHNLNGTDLFPLICAAAAKRGAGIFLLGGEPGVADGAAAWACAQWPSLRICGTQNGFFDPAEEDALIERINTSGASMLFVGFGVPLQENWIARNRERLTMPVVLGVGGLFDYYSGRIARAPRLVRAMRGEWLWRLAMEPRRMARRYLLGNGVFLLHAALHAAHLRGWDRGMGDAAKRALDLVVAVLALVVLSPILLAAALAIRIEDGGPVFFRQVRIGTDGRPFSMIKFRSMFTDAEARRAALLASSDRAGTCFKMARDPRITRVGRVIRRLSIDELPQLFNVIGGSMSLVGPRPALGSEVVNYRLRQWDRLRGKPGITGRWQVKGRAEIPFHRQAIMDRAYLRRRSLLVDLKLLAQTVPAVIGGRGAY